MPQAPGSYSGTILGNNDGMDALTRHFGNIIEQTEKYKQREELKQAKLDASLIPPEYDLSGISEKNRQEIMADMKGYEQEAMNLYNQGISHLDPKNRDVYTKMRERERMIEDKVLTAKQLGSIGGDFIKKRSTKEYIDNFDDPASMLNYSQFQEGSIKDQNDFISKTGSLLVQNPWDKQSYLRDNLVITDKMYSEQEPTFSSKNGMTVTETISEIPEGSKTYQADINLYGGGKGAATYLADTKEMYEALTPDQQAVYQQKAIENGHQDPLIEFAKNDFAMLFPTKKGYTSAKITSNNDSASDPNNSQSGLLLQLIAGIRAGDESYMPPVEGSLGGLAALAGTVGNITKSGGFLNIPVGSYQQKTTTGFKSVPEVIEQFVQGSDGNIYKISNRTKDQGKMGGGIKGGELMQDGDFNTLFQIALDQLTQTERAKLLSQMRKDGQIGENGEILWDKVIPRQTTTQTTTTTKKSTTLQKGSLDDL